MESGWIRRYPAMPGFLLEQSTTSRWVFRRYPVVTRPLAQVATTTSDGVAVLRPEIALLFKAKATRFKEPGGLRPRLPHLDEAARVWLA